MPGYALLREYTSMRRGTCATLQNPRNRCPTCPLINMAAIKTQLRLIDSGNIVFTMIILFYVVMIMVKLYFQYELAAKQKEKQRQKEFEDAMARASWRIEYAAKNRVRRNFGMLQEKRASMRKGLEAQTAAKDASKKTTHEERADMREKLDLEKATKDKFIEHYKSLHMELTQAALVSGDMRREIEVHRAGMDPASDWFQPDVKPNASQGAGEDWDVVDSDDETDDSEGTGEDWDMIGSDDL